MADANGDGKVDGTDPDADGILGAADAVPATRGDANDPTPVNTDGLTTPDYTDLDSDNDGLTDLAESGIPNAPALDPNGDGKIDNPADPDGDGIPQAVDGAPTTFGDVNNPTLPDGNNNGTPDFRDPSDIDGDGIADATDLDDDNDGILDTVEDAQLSPDTDGDSVPNKLDLDSDNDGINDVIEANGTDANRDAIADGPVSSQGIPASAGAGLTPPDTDGDTRPNPYDLDSDNDGINDLVECGNPLLADANGDGKVDGTDPDADGILGVADAVPTTRGDANDPTPVNTDGLTTPDYADLDSDNDGLTDLAESGIPNPATLDPNGDGKIDNPADGDGDGIPQVCDGLPTAFGDSNNPALPDTDADGTPDYVDASAPAADLFPNYTFSNTTFNVGDVRDVIININEIKGNSTTGQIQFFVPFSSGFTYTFNPTQSTSTVLTPQTVNNSAWTATNTGTGLLFTSSQVIPGNGRSRIAISVKADTKGTDANITTNITPLSGGETNGLNNIAVLSQSVQN